MFILCFFPFSVIYSGGPATYHEKGVSISIMIYCIHIFAITSFWFVVEEFIMTYMGQKMGP